MCAGSAAAQLPAGGELSAIYREINGGKYADALRRLEALAKISPTLRSPQDLLAIRTYYGRACLGTGHLQEAEEALVAAASQRLAGGPSYPMASRELAVLHLVKREYAAAAVKLVTGHVTQCS